MTIEILNKAIIEAMKTKDAVKRDTLRSAVGNIKKVAIEKKNFLSLNYRI